MTGLRKKIGLKVIFHRCDRFFRSMRILYNREDGRAIYGKPKFRYKVGLIELWWTAAFTVVQLENWLFKGTLRY